VLVTHFKTIVDPVDQVLIFLRLLIEDESTLVQVFHEVIVVVFYSLQLLIHLSYVIGDYALSILIPLDHLTVLQLVKTVRRDHQHRHSVLDALKHTIVPTMVEEHFGLVVFEETLLGDKGHHHNVVIRSGQVNNILFIVLFVIL
jgi:hypothetical protein